MDQALYVKLANQVARQTPELAALDAEIAAQQPNVDGLQAAFDAAREEVERREDELAKAGDDVDTSIEQEALATAHAAFQNAKDGLAAPKAALDSLKERAEPIRAAIARCQQAMQDSGLTVDVNAVRLAQAKAVLWERIKAERDRRKLEGGYTAVGKWFHSDTFSRTQQIGLVMLGAGIPAGTPWKTMDGSFVLMTPTLAQQVFGAAAAQDLATFAAAEAHKAAMEASADPAAYNFSGGWPPIFGA